MEEIGKKIQYASSLEHKENNEIQTYKKKSKMQTRSQLLIEKIITSKYTTVTQQSKTTNIMHMDRVYNTSK